MASSEQLSEENVNARPQIPLETPTKREIIEIPDPIGTPVTVPATPEPLKVPKEPVPVGCIF